MPAPPRRPAPIGWVSTHHGLDPRPGVTVQVPPQTRRPALRIRRPAPRTRRPAPPTPHVGPRCARRQPTHAGTSTTPSAHRVGLDPPWPRPSPRSRIDARPSTIQRLPQTRRPAPRSPHVGPRYARRQPTNAGTSTPPRAHRVGLDPPWPRPLPQSRIDARPSKTHRTLVEAALQAPLPRPTVASLGLRRSSAATGNRQTLFSACLKGRGENGAATFATTPPHATVQSRAHPRPTSPRAHP
jgi:hypothetical protein